MSLDERSVFLRKRMLDLLSVAGRGHLPSAFSCAEILRVLYDSILNVHPENPEDADRDRLIFSKGHACYALYTILEDKGFIPAEELRSVCAFDSTFGGHPTRSPRYGIEGSTGSLGHGPALGVGMALAARMDGRTSRVFVLCGDGETDEGSVWESALAASKHKLDNFTLIIDYNKFQSWDYVENILPLEPYADKWRSFGFAVREVDGHDVAALASLFAALPFESGRPSAVIAHTVKGKGIPAIENNAKWHHKTKLSEEERAALIKELEANLS